MILYSIGIYMLSICWAYAVSLPRMKSLHMRNVSDSLAPMNYVPGFEGS